MTTLATISTRLQEAWASVPTPPAEDMKLMSWGWGDEAAAAFTGVAPLEVDRNSVGFYAATPLLDLPPRAAAAYLGTFLLSLIEGIVMQQTLGLFDDILQRAHTLTCLETPHFWEQVIHGELPAECVEVVRETVDCIVEHAELLLLDADQVKGLSQLAQLDADEIIDE